MSDIIWLTDRSRYETGTGRCRWQRYLGYYAGPTGYGYVRRGESIPLATGIYTHLGVEHLLKYLQQHDALPTDDYIQDAVKLALDKYNTKIVDRGFRGLLQSESSDLVLREQQNLVEGMIWGFAVYILPWMQTEFRILECEVEKVYPLSDSVGLMQRLDCLAENKRKEGLAYLDIKTSGRTGDQFAEEWETKPQLGLGSLGALEKYGKEVVDLWVIGLNKGYRKKYDDGTKRQESPYCYGYRRPDNPPLSTLDWKASYDYVDEQGKNRKVGKEYQKAPTHEYPGGVAAWVKQLPETTLKKQVFLVGPLSVQQHQLAAMLVEMVAEEERWQQDLWTVYEVAQQHGWESPEFQEILSKTFPRSWNCRPFGAAHECEFVPLCFRLDGWQDPLGSGKYAPRLPHHEPEREQMKERGLMPEGLEQEEDE